jgi:hypothetical protein
VSHSQTYITLNAAPSGGACSLSPLTVLLASPLGPCSVRAGMILLALRTINSTVSKCRHYFLVVEVFVQLSENCKI